MSRVCVSVPRLELYSIGDRVGFGTGIPVTAKTMLGDLVNYLLENERITECEPVEPT
jgi:hypothetical protein